MDGKSVGGIMGLRRGLESGDKRSVALEDSPLPPKPGLLKSVRLSGLSDSDHLDLLLPPSRSLNHLAGTHQPMQSNNQSQYITEADNEEDGWAGSSEVVVWRGTEYMRWHFDGAAFCE